MTLPQRLKTAREFLGLSQKDMAAALGSSLGGWQSNEAGKTVPGGKVLQGLARLGFHGQWLLAGEGPMRSDQVGAEQGAVPVSTEFAQAVLAVVRAAGVRVGEPPGDDLAPDERQLVQYYRSAAEPYKQALFDAAKGLSGLPSGNSEAESSPHQPTGTHGQ